MNVTSYTFQSPYPHQVQIGRPDPQSQQQEQQTEAVNNLASVESRPTQPEADAYIAQATGGASVNVANVSTDMGVSSALESFTSTNNQAQAVTAYSS
ncbi:MAG: hypothetical protein U9Q62_03180 [Campylobacterota bacterium]|nr:hypothetical protein [Campylobacterota bacterium]